MIRGFEFQVRVSEAGNEKFSCPAAISLARIRRYILVTPFRCKVYDKVIDKDTFHLECTQAGQPSPAGLRLFTGPCHTGKALGG